MVSPDSGLVPQVANLWLVTPRRSLLHSFTLTSYIFTFLLAALYFTYSFTRTATSVSDRIFEFVFVIGGISLLLGFIFFLFALLFQFPQGVFFSSLGLPLKS